MKHPLLLLPQGVQDGRVVLQLALPVVGRVLLKLERGLGCQSGGVALDTCWLHTLSRALYTPCHVP